MLEARLAPDGTLTPKHSRLVDALVTGLSVEDAAASCNVARRTAYNWLKLDHFQRALRAEQRRFHNFAMMKLLGKVEKTINCLDRNMDGFTRGGHAQVMAASKVLDAAHEHVNVTQLENEIEQLRQELRRHES